MQVPRFSCKSTCRIILNYTGVLRAKSFNRSSYINFRFLATRVTPQLNIPCCFKSNK